MDRLRFDRQKPTSSGWNQKTWQQQMVDVGALDDPKEKNLSRRAFLIGSATVVGTIGWSGRYSAFAKFLDEKSYRQYDHDKVVAQAKSYLKETYAINLMVGIGDAERIAGDQPRLEDYRATLKVLMEELSKYPPAMIRKVAEAKGFNIRIASKLRRVAKEGKTIVTYPISGRADSYTPYQLFLNTDAIPFDSRRTINHELNHEFAALFQNMDERQKLWTDFHAEVNQQPYLPQPRGVDANEEPPEPYFLNFNARISFLEDQAVFAEYMLTPRLHLQLVERIQKEKDPATKQILIGKYTETKANYLAWSDGKMNDEFWRSVVDLGLKQRQRNVYE